MKVKIKKLNENVIIPEYSTKLSAGVDLRAYIPESITLKPLERRLIKTGLSIELPNAYEAQIRPRSGLAIKHGITVLNSPGTIDEDFRGEIGVILINLSDEPFIINNGDRICQMVFKKYEQAEWFSTEELSSTERGTGGFGHTGNK